MSAARIDVRADVWANVRKAAFWFVLFVVLQAVLSEQAKTRLPSAAQIRLAYGIPRETYFGLKENYSIDDCALAEADATAYVSHKEDMSASARVRLVLTEERFAWITNLRVTAGAFFVNTDDNLAVISEELALQLFMSVDILGAELRIDGLRYTVCGVYTSEKSLAGVLSSDDAERVYLPLASEAGKAASVRDMFAPSADMSEIEQLIAERRAMLLAEGVPVENVRNHANTLALIVQNGRIQWFFLTFFAAAMLIVLSVRKLVSAYGNGYGQRIGKQEVLLYTGLIAAGLVIAVLSAFTPFFPQGLITSAGRIDPVHMFQLFLADTKTVNSVGADFWARYGHRALVWSCLLCAGAVGAAGMVGVRGGKAVSVIIEGFVVRKR